MKYPKINTLFKRDADNIIIPDQWSLPEFEYLKNVEFECTEKIDGTNIRIEVIRENRDIFVEFAGRTDNADIPKFLLEKLNKLFSVEKLTEVFVPQFEENEDFHITLFGEGYGNKIQKDGSKYLANDVNFILFDINVNGIWLKRKDIVDIAYKLNIKVVPLIGKMTIEKAIEYVKKGFVSAISEDRNFIAEGLILKTPCGLLDRRGNRIILKIKHKDFVKFKAKYGDNMNPVQPIKE